MEAGAAAVVTGQEGTDLCAVHQLGLRQQLRAGHQHAGRAEAALQRVAVYERLLEVCNLAGVGQSLNGDNLRAVRLHRQHQAAAHDLAVHAQRAGAADAVLAAEVRAGQHKVHAHEIDQVLAHRHNARHMITVDGECYMESIIAQALLTRSAARASARRVSTCRRILLLACGLVIGDRSFSRADAAAFAIISSMRWPTMVARAPCARVGLSSLAKYTSRASATMSRSTTSWSAMPAIAKSPCRRASSMNTETGVDCCTGIRTSTNNSLGHCAVS